jgi:ketosteroid isomerase-like protein
MDEGSRELVERLFDAFNRRDEGAITELCDETMKFYAVTGQEVGRGDPYTGPEGLREYLDDVATVWEELLITPKEIEEEEGGWLLVRGRVFLRSRVLGIRDMPSAWILELRGGRFVEGQVFIDPEEAVKIFSREARPGPGPDLRTSRSMTRLR